MSKEVTLEREDTMDAQYLTITKERKPSNAGILMTLLSGRKIEKVTIVPDCVKLEFDEGTSCTLKAMWDVDRSYLQVSFESD